MSSVEDKSRMLRWTLITAIAPIAWGSTYFVTREFLPTDAPLWGAVIRALPAGVLLLALRPRLPRGAWWWRSLVLGILNVGAFFVLVYLAAQLLPTSIASTVMATSPVVMMVFAWALLAQRPTVLPLVGAGLGLGGVALMLTTGTTSIDWLGVAASVGALTMSSLGYILSTRWGRDGIELLPATSWQLLAGGLVLVPVALLAEGAPPSLDAPALLGFAYITVIATALAFVAWFGGLRRLSAGAVGLIGLLNPVTGVLLGTLVAGESLTVQQMLGLGIVGVGILIGQPVVAAAVRARTDRPRSAPSPAAHALPGPSARAAGSAREARPASPPEYS